MKNACLKNILVKSRCCHPLRHLFMVIAHRHARTSSHSAEKLNPCLSGKVVSHVLVSGHLCMVAEQSCVLRRWFALEPCTDGYVGRATGAVGTSAAPGWEHTASSELQDYDSGNGHSCDQLHLPRWSTCVCSGSRLSLLATKHHGRAGASSCCNSQRQSLGPESASRPDPSSERARLWNYANFVLRM